MNGTDIFGGYICDTHAHYDDKAFDGDREKLLKEELPCAGVCLVVNMGSTMEGAEESVQLARRYDYVYAGCGIHPDEIGIFEDSPSLLPKQAFIRLNELCQDPRTVAVGEIGLDYHWMVRPREVQKKWFAEQLALASRMGKPVNIHSRKAAQDTFDMIKGNFCEGGGKEGGIIHCYSGSLELAREYVKMGYYIGIGGAVTYRNSKTLKKIVEEIPLEYLVTETDCPYMAPEPLRGTRNDSRNIRYVIEQIAQLRHMDVLECARILCANAFRVYGIDKM